MLVSKHSLMRADDQMQTRRSEQLTEPLKDRKTERLVDCHYFRLRNAFISLPTQP